MLIDYWIENLNIEPNNIKAIYQLDFYLSGAISIMSRWIENKNDMSREEIGLIIQHSLTDCILKDIG